MPVKGGVHKMNPKQIKHIMIDHDVKQKDLAAATGYSDASITRLLNCKSIPDRTGLCLIRALKEISEGRTINAD